MTLLMYYFLILTTLTLIFDLDEFLNNFFKFFKVSSLKSSDFVNENSYIRPFLYPASRFMIGVLDKNNHLHLF